MLQLIGKPTGGYTVAVSVAGPAPRSTVSISGTPIQTQLPTINFNQADFAIDSPAREGETWAVVLDGTAYPYVVKLTDTSSADIATGLLSAIPAAFTTKFVNGSVLSVGKAASFTAAIRVTPSGAGLASAAPRTPRAASASPARSTPATPGPSR